MLTKNNRIKINNQIETIKNWCLHMNENESVKLHQNILLQELDRLNNLIDNS
jgi:hypothetical protein